MNKAILKLEIQDDKEKKEVMKTVSDLSGVDSISMDMKEKKLTVIGDIDPVNIVSKLRKLCHTEIVSVVPAKEPEKKKDDGNKKKDKPKKEAEIVTVGPVSGIFKVDTSYNPRMPSYPPPKSADDDTSGCACVIL